MKNEPKLWVRLAGGARNHSSLKCRDHAQLCIPKDWVATRNNNEAFDTKNVYWCGRVWPLIS